MRNEAVFERSREEGHAAPRPIAEGPGSSVPPDDFAEDILLEMANLTEQDTGVPGTIFISTALGSHGPRVKWYPGSPGRELPCLVVSIAPEPVVRDDFLPPRVSRQARPSILGWVKLNQEALLRFWEEGETWDRHRVAAFLDRLRPLPESRPGI